MVALKKHNKQSWFTHECDRTQKLKTHLQALKTIEEWKYVELTNIKEKVSDL
jgi:hypothetical protein